MNHSSILVKTRLLSLLGLVAVSSFLWVVPIHAQPAPVAEARPDITASGGMAFGYHNQKLYIQGGTRSNSVPMSSFFVLDLSIPWPTNNPAWVSNLQNPPVMGVSGGILTSGEFVVRGGPTATNGSLFVYSDSIRTWSEIPIGNTATHTGTGQQLVTSLIDNHVYLLKDGISVEETSFRFNSLDESTRLEDGQAASWSTGLNRILATNPSAEDGSKFYLYGGRSSTEPNARVFNELWSFDIKDNSWRPLASSPLTPRHSMACAVAGNTFVVWGGFIDTNDRLPSPLPELYDITSNTWGVTEYRPATASVGGPFPDTPSPTENTPGGSDGGGTGSSNIGAIAGGIAGGVAVLALLGFFLFRQRRRANGKSGRHIMAARSGGVETGALAIPEKEEYIEIHERNMPVPLIAEPTMTPGDNPQPVSAAMPYPVSAPIITQHQYQPQNPPPPPLHSRPIQVVPPGSYPASIESSSGTGSLPVIQSPFDDHPDVGIHHPLLAPVKYTPMTQHQPKPPPEPEVIDLMPITRSEAGSIHSRTNSLSSRHSVARRSTVRTTADRGDALLDDQEVDPEDLEYL
ncbi:hypothetical protein BGZ94_010163 [Podila epigama]|nr:hypothetical protein BGZ94_010163 [Podila epigama]